MSWMQKICSRSFSLLTPLVTCSCAMRAERLDLDSLDHPGPAGGGNATVAVPMVVIISSVVLAFEVLVVMHSVTIRGVSSSWAYQLLGAGVSLVAAVQYSFVIPMSYDLSRYSGGGAAASGFFIGSNGIGLFVGICISRLAWHVMSPSQIHAAIVLPVIANAGLGVVLASLLASGTPTQLELLFLRIAMGLFEGVGQLIHFLVRQKTPAHEQVRAAVLEYSAYALGLGLGPLLSSKLGAEQGIDNKTPFQPSAAALSAVSAAVAFLCVCMAAVLVLAIPSSPKDFKREHASVAGAEDAACNRSNRAAVVFLCLVQFSLCFGVAASIEVTTALLLEVDGGWQYHAIGRGIGAVLAATAVAGAGLMAIQESGLVDDAVATWVMLMVAAAGAMLLLRTHGMSAALAADFLMYPTLVCVASVGEGTAIEASNPMSVFSQPNILVMSSFADAAARAIFTPLGRFVFDEGGRTGYACMLLMIVAVIAVADVLIRLLRGMASSEISDDYDKLQVKLGAQGQAEKGPDFLKVFDVPLIEKVEVRDSECGKGLVATQPIRQGELIYRAKCHFLPDLPGKVLLQYGSVEYVLDVFMHASLLGPNIREMGEVDSFTNHSCEPNIFYGSTQFGNGSSGDYGVYALKNISPGTELTADYELFDIDLQTVGMDLSPCKCGSSTCRGSIRGCKYWPLEVLLARLAEVERIPRAYLLQQHPTVQFLDFGKSTGLLAAPSDSESRWPITAACDFEPGAVICEGKSCVLDFHVCHMVVNFPVQLGPECWLPRTVVFAKEDLIKASAPVNGVCGQREERRFFGLDLAANGQQADAEIRMISPTEGHHATEIFQVRSRVQIRAGQAFTCLAPCLHIS